MKRFSGLWERETEKERSWGSLSGAGDDGDAAVEAEGGRHIG